VMLVNKQKAINYHTLFVLVCPITPWNLFFF
jgi:hypothetical protein